MTKLARRHHYIPQGYLRGFSQQRKEGQWLLNVTDLKQKRCYSANPTNVCLERDFMRINVPGYAPDYVETVMSAFETKCIEAVHRVAASGRFEGKDANLTMNLMALLAVRSPDMRERTRVLYEQVAKKMLGLSLSTKDLWESEVERLRAAGEPLSSSLTYEGMKDFYTRGQYKISVKRESHMKTELQIAPAILEELGKRLWTVYTNDGTQGDFVTTDRPVTLTSIDTSITRQSLLHNQGFASERTEVYFPLTRHVMLVGRWDRGGRWNQEGGHTEKAQTSFIGAVNAHMVRHSFGQIFSLEKKILYTDPWLNLHWDEALLQRFTEPYSDSVFHERKD